MNKTTIFYKSKNILIEQLEKQSNIEVLKEKNFFSKIFSSKRFPDIYFHSGILDEDSKENKKILDALLKVIALHETDSPARDRKEFAKKLARINSVLEFR